MQFINESPVRYDDKSCLFIKRIQGILVIYGPIDFLRLESLWIHHLKTSPSTYYPATMDYHYLSDWRKTEGEVQIFHDYQRRLRDAKRARADILNGPNPPTNPKELELAIKLRAHEIRQAEIDAST